MNAHLSTTWTADRLGYAFCRDCWFTLAKDETGQNHTPKAEEKCDRCDRTADEIQRDASLLQYSKPESFAYPPDYWTWKAD